MCVLLACSPIAKRFLATLAILGIAATADAADVTWTGSESDTWTTDANWSSGTTPGAGDAVSINLNSGSMPVINNPGAQTQSLLLGNSASTARLTIATGGSLVTSQGVGIGQVVGTAGEAYVSGSWTIGGLVAVGEAGSASTLRVENGGMIQTGTIHVDNGFVTTPGDGGNSVSVSGTGSRLFATSLIVGAAGGGGNNQFHIDQGGVAELTELQIGYTSNNEVTVSGQGSTLNLLGEYLAIGQNFNATGNSLNIFDGGKVSVQAGDFGYVYMYGQSTLNLNAGGTLEIGGRGIVQDVGGSIFNFSGGTMRVRDMDLDTSAGANVNGSSTIDTNGYNATISGAYTGTDSLTKIGSGTLSLTNETILRDMNVTAGTLAAVGSGSLSRNFNVGRVEDLTGTAIVTGTWTVANSVIIGRSGSNNSLRIENGGVVQDAESVLVGDNFTTGAGGNELVVTGTGSQLVADGYVVVGSVGSNNRFHIEDGGYVEIEQLIIGQHGNANEVTVTGEGSTLSITDYSLTLGYYNDSDDNSLTIENGGKVSVQAGEQGYVELGLYGDNNTLTLNAGGTLEIGGTNGLRSSGTNGAIFNFTGGTLRVRDADLTSSTDASVNGNSTIDTNGLNATLSGAYTGTSSLNKIGSGTLALTGEVSLRDMNVTAGSLAASGNGTLSRNFNIGRAEGSTGSAIVTGTWGVINSIIIGRSGSNNSLRIENGGVFRSLSSEQTVLVGDNFMTGAGGNELVVSGTGSQLLSGSSYVIVGSTGSGNRFQIENGGYAEAGQLLIGQHGGDNEVIVTGQGSTLDIGYYSLTLGYYDDSNDNTLTIENGGTVSVRPGDQGYVELGLYGGDSTLNLNAGGTLEIGGTNGLRSGTGAATFNFAGGTLRVREADLTSSIDANVSGSSTIDTNAQNATLSGVYSGTGSLTKIGTGTLALTGSADLDRLVVNEGMLLSSSSVSTANEIVIGEAAGSSASAVLSGTWSALALIVGDSGSNNSLRIENGGKVSTPTHTTVGYGLTSGGGNNELIVSGTGSQLSTNQLNVGAYDGDNNSLHIENGGLAEAWGMIIGYETSTNNVLVTGEGSTLSLLGYALNLGYYDTAKDNVLTIENGGKVTFAATGLAYLQLDREGSGSILNLNEGGTLEIGDTDGLRAGSDTAIFNFSGGTLRVRDVALTSSVNATMSGSSTIDTNSLNATISGTYSGTGSLSKAGLGTLTLTASNSYSGGTIVRSGTLQAQNNYAVGNGSVNVAGGTFLLDVGVSASNKIILSGGTYQRNLDANTDLAGIVNATSNFGIRTDITANVLSGTTSGTAALKSSFSAYTSTGAEGETNIIGDIYHLDGVPVVNIGTGETDLFVLQLSVEQTIAEANLGWFDLDANAWVNAVEGNFGNNYLGGIYNGSFADFQIVNGYDLSLYVGAWGWEQTDGTTAVWAVLNHNSEFAMVPEPSTYALLVGGLGLVAVVLRRRKRV